MGIYFICTQIVDLWGVSIKNLAQKWKDLAGGDMHGFARKIRKMEELPKKDNFWHKTKK